MYIKLFEDFVSNVSYETILPDIATISKYDKENGKKPLLRDIYLAIIEKRESYNQLSPRITWRLRLSRRVWEKYKYNKDYEQDFTFFIEQKRWKGGFVECGKILKDSNLVEQPTVVYLLFNFGNNERYAEEVYLSDDLQRLRAIADKAGFNKGGRLVILDFDSEYITMHTIDDMTILNTKVDEMAD